MDDLREYITSLWTGCRDPVKQVELICELTGQRSETVIRVLRDTGKIPRRVTAKNYRTALAQLPPPKISDEMRKYIVSSPKWAETLARELRLPLDTVEEIRRAAYEKVGGRYTGGSGTLKKFKTGCARHAKDAPGDGDRAGAGARRGRPRKAAG